jgi:hypothetical protein
MKFSNTRSEETKHDVVVIGWQFAAFKLFC